MLGSATNIAKGDVVKASFISRFYLELYGWTSIWICHIVTRKYVKSITRG